MRFYISPMNLPMNLPCRGLACVVIGAALLSLNGCSGVNGNPFASDDNRSAASEGDQPSQFSAARMRLHPIFTQVASWEGGAKPDGIEAEVEFQDRFGDPTKSAGNVRFELFRYRQAQPDPRGERLALWDGPLQTVGDQRTYWHKTSQAFIFRLGYPQINKYSNYVLTATFESVDGRRYFSKVILEGQKPEDNSAQFKIPTTQTSPATHPATKPAPAAPATKP